jgi:anti-sigma-K factor RskA
MTPHTDIQAEMRQFLLGILSEDVRRQVEERLMTEEGFMEELTLAEAELIDDYVGERLSAAERAEFERHFLSTEERRRQLRFTQSLSRYANAHPPAAAVAAGAAESGATREPSPRPAPTFGERLRAFWVGLSAPARAGMALACVAVLVGAVWLARPASPSFNPAFPAFTLAPGSGNRATGPETQRVELPPSGGLRLTLMLPAGSGPAAAYRAEVLDSVGRRVGDAAVVGHDERSVSAVVPEGLLARGSYVIQLYAAGADKKGLIVDSYLFDVK